MPMWNAGWCGVSERNGNLDAEQDWATDARNLCEPLRLRRLNSICFDQPDMAFTPGVRTRAAP